MADNFAMPNQQVPIGAKPAEYNYGTGNELVERGVQLVGSVLNKFGSSLEKRRDEIAKGRKEHMDEAAANARGDAQTEWNKIAAKGAMKFATKAMMADINTNNILRIGESGLASSAKTGSKNASATFNPPPANAQPSAVASPAAKPRIKRTESRVDKLPNGGTVRTTVPIGTKNIDELHKASLQGHSTATPTTPTRAKATTPKSTTRSTAPKPTGNKAPTAKAPAAKPPAARKPRPPK